MAQYNYDYVVLKGSKSPANFSINFATAKYIQGVRFVKSYKTELPIPTDRKFQTLQNPNSYEFVNLQSKKVIEHELEIEFKENINLAILAECDKLEIIDRNGVSIDVKLANLEFEALENTQLRKATFIFTEILADENSLSSFVESDYVLQRVQANDFSNEIFLQLDSDKTIGGDIVSAVRFYTIFFPFIGRENVDEDKTLFKTKTGNTYTISTYDCQVLRLKLFLNDDNLAIFRKYAKRCYYKDATGNDKGVSIGFNGITYQASQTLNDDDIIINENDTLVNLNEVDVILKNDFIKHEIL